MKLPDGELTRKVLMARSDQVDKVDLNTELFNHQQEAKNSSRRLIVMAKSFETLGFAYLSDELRDIAMSVQQSAEKAYDSYAKFIRES